jgi:MoxR-like ATPase
MAGRDYVIPEDVKQVALPALAHRMTLRPEMWLKRVDPAAVVLEVLEATPSPASGSVSLPHQQNTDFVYGTR